MSDPYKCTECEQVHHRSLDDGLCPRCMQIRYGMPPHGSRIMQVKKRAIDLTVIVSLDWERDNHLWAVTEAGNRVSLSEFSKDNRETILKRWEAWRSV